MKKEELIGFIVDSIGITTAFFLNSIFLVLFYQITTNGAAEIIYPIVICFTIYIIYIFFRAIGYFNYIKRLKALRESRNFKVDFLSYHRKLVFEICKYQFEKYMSELGQATSKMKGFRHFFAQWIHSMKTPVSVIELVLQNDDILEIEALKKEVKEEVNRLTDNLDKALGFIRLEDFSKDYLPQEIDLRKCIEETIYKKKREFIYNKVFPKVICNEANTSILTDLKWNELMIDQLTNNAIKYSRSENESKNLYYIIERKGRSILLTIKDEGMGIPKQDINRIFDAFFTGDNGRKVSNASGVGLYLVKEVADRLGHKLKYNSKVGQGSEFQIVYLSKM